MKKLSGRVFIYTLYLTVSEKLIKCLHYLDLNAFLKRILPYLVLR